MAKEAATAKDARFKLISLLPDVCLTPKKKDGKPVPYPVIHGMELSRQCSPNVFFRGKPAYLHNESFVDDLKGDEPGRGKGVVSGTHKAISHNIGRSTSVYVNGKPIVRTGDQMWMNWQPPEGVPLAAMDYTPTKAERWRCRMAQIAAGKKSDDPKVKEAAQRFEKNNFAVEKARLAEDTYDPDKGPPEGWKNISDDPEALSKYGLEPEDLEQPGSDFRAQVYEPDQAVFGDDMRPTLAFKGTSSGQDWGENLAQGMDMHSDYYERAVDIGKTLKERGIGLDITGHSLGGGLASAASRASGLPATTFNAAGLHGNTVSHYGGVVHESSIDAYRVDGEILTGVQELNFWGTAGAILVGPVWGLGKIVLAESMPDAAGVPHALPGSGLNPVDRHGMKQVIDGIESQKSEDQAVLAGETGIQCP